MSRYIDADKLHEHITTNHCGECGIYNGEICCSCPMDKALNYIEDFPTANVAPRAEWISVKERVPDGNGVFIVSLKERGYENLVYFDVRSYADGEWRNLPDKFTVSHWMPLPEPPKGE